MNSKFSILLILLLMIGVAGQANAYTIDATPSNVPKGAYVNGPGDPAPPAVSNTDDNYFFQKVVLTSAAAHLATQTAIITLPTGMEVADVDESGTFVDEVSIQTNTNPMTVAATASTITLTFTGAFSAGQTVTVMFPVVTEVEPVVSTGDYSVVFSVVADPITGTGQTITYVDPGPNTVGLVTFDDILAADDDSTNAKGDRYPETPAATYGALPDLIIELLAANQIEAANSNLIGYDLDQAGVDGGDETVYKIWVSTDSTLAHVDSLTAGVFSAIDHSDLSRVLDDEAGTGAFSYSLSGYPEGDYYFYITSNVTSDFSLARSGKLTLLHWPVINAVGWDRDHVGGYVPASDDLNVTLDSGDYFDYSGVAASTGHFTFVDIYSHVDDLDDNAKVHLFYSTETALDTTDVVTSGSSGDGTLTITGLTGATAIVSNLLENSEDDQGFIRHRWSMDPDTTGVHPAGSLTVYCIASDGKHYDITKLEGTDVSGYPDIVSAGLTLTTIIKNSPKLQLDDLLEYDSTPIPAGAVDINVQDHDQIVISWAKNGVGGDIDIDNSAKISLYIHDEDTNVTSVWPACDFGHNSAAAIVALNASNPTEMHKIADNILEDLDSKDQSWYTWDLASDSWNPVDGTNYVIYAIIDDQVAPPNNTSIVTTILTTGATFFNVGDNLSSAGIGRELVFTNSPYARLTVPPAEGVIINAEETYRMPFTAFDWDDDAEVNIYVVSTTAVGGTTDFASGPLTVAVGGANGIVSTADGEAYCLTDDDGDSGVIAGTAALSEDTDTYYDVQIRVPGSAAAFYDDAMTAGVGVIDLADGDYWVYIAIGETAGVIGAATPAYRAPGILTIVNAGNTALQRNLTISPAAATVAQGDTVDISLMGVIPAVGAVDRIDAYVAVEKDWWDVVSPSAPFTASSTFTGLLLTNTVIDDTVGDRWILRTVVSDAGDATQFDFLPLSGVGGSVATFQLVSKGTSDALQHQTSVYYVNEPANGWVTRFYNDGSAVNVNTLSNTTLVGPRAIIEGIAELQGRTDMNTTMTFELRERGGYDSISDSLFYAANDLDSAENGVQYTTDIDGKFSFYNVPTGEYDLTVSYNRYLSKLVQVDVYPGIDTLFVNFDILKGGDSVGYTDSLGYVYPNNKIDIGDINRIQTAFLATSASSEWDDGTNNWKWSDINEDGIVEVDDLSMATGNEDEVGAQPVFNKPATQVNEAAFVDFMNVPSELKIGEAYTIQVVAHNITDARAYFVNMNYNKEALTFAGITKGDLIESDSYSFPVVGEGLVGIANSAFGNYTFSGTGVLAEVTFTANFDGAFSADMLGFEKASIVNANFIRENIIGESITAIDSGDAPVAFALGQNFPNPFNPTTTIEFAIPQNEYVSIKVFDVLGRHVRTLVSSDYSAGNYSVMWDATDMNGSVVSNGIYFYTIEAGNLHVTKRMLFLK